MLLNPPKDVRFSVAQQALVRLEKIRVQGAFVVVNVLLLLLVGYTSHRFPHKYVRVTGECDSNWLPTNAKQESHEIICCDAKKGFHGVPCYNGMELSTILSSTQGAWVIPMMALIFNYVAMILGPNASLPRVRVLVRRALLYLALMGFRTFVLYLGFNEVEKNIVRLLFGSSSHSCWYAHLRRNQRCTAHFDHSDHLVLLVSHYLAISIFEWFALSIESPTRSFKKVALQLWIVLITGLASYTLFFTASYFHTGLENLVGLLIAQVCIMLPLYLLSQDRFAKYKLLQLNSHCDSTGDEDDEDDDNEEESALLGLDDDVKANAETTAEDAEDVSISIGDEDFHFSNLEKEDGGGDLRVLSRHKKDFQEASICK